MMGGKMNRGTRILGKLVLLALNVRSYHLSNPRLARHVIPFEDPSTVGQVPPCFFACDLHTSSELIPGNHCTCTTRYANR